MNVLYVFHSVTNQILHDIKLMFWTDVGPRRKVLLIQSPLDDEHSQLFLRKSGCQILG